MSANQLETHCAFDFLMLTKKDKTVKLRNDPKWPTQPALNPISGGVLLFALGKTKAEKGDCSRWLHTGNMREHARTVLSNKEVILRRSS